MANKDTPPKNCCKKKDMFHDFNWPELENILLDMHLFRQITVPPEYFLLKIYTHDSNLQACLNDRSSGIGNYEACCQVFSKIMIDRLLEIYWTDDDEDFPDFEGYIG